MFKDAAQASALHGIVELVVKWVHVDRQAAFAPQVVPGVLVAGLDGLVGQAQFGCEFADEQACVLAGVVAGHALVGKQIGVGPYGLLVGAPVNVQRPARQLLAGVPLALAKVQKTALTIFLTQFEDQFGGKATLGGA